MHRLGLEYLPTIPKLPMWLVKRHPEHNRLKALPTNGLVINRNMVALWISSQPGHLVSCVGLNIPLPSRPWKADLFPGEPDQPGSSVSTTQSTIEQIEPLLTNLANGIAKTLGSSLDVSISQVASQLGDSLLRAATDVFNGLIEQVMNSIGDFIDVLRKGGNAKWVKKIQALTCSQYSCAGAD